MFIYELNQNNFQKQSLWIPMSLLFILERNIDQKQRLTFMFQKILLEADSLKNFGHLTLNFQPLAKKKNSFEIEYLFILGKIPPKLIHRHVMAL